MITAQYPEAGAISDWEPEPKQPVGISRLKKFGMPVDKFFCLDIKNG